MKWERAKVIIERFENMASVNLLELKQLHKSVEASIKLNNAEKVLLDKRNATRKIDQLQEWLKQVLELRAKLDIEDLDKFDQKIDPIRIKITSTIRSLSQLCLTEVQSEENRNIYDELYQAQTSAFGDEEVPVSFRQQEQKLNAAKMYVERARQDAEETKRLAENIEDLNEIMLELGQLVHSQHEVVDSIEEHVESTRCHVVEAHKNLKKAQASRSTKVPLVAAAVGGIALGGPVGVAAGSAAAGVFAALGGAVAGLYSGKFLKRKADDAANRSD